MRWGLPSGARGNVGRVSGARRTNLLPQALIAVALLAGGLAAGIVIAGLRTPHRAVAAPGLKADALPGGLDGTPAPAFRLADARGGTVDTRALRGRPYAVTFLYTRCPDVCPTLAADLRDAQARRPFTVVAVSVDPRGDTRRAVKAFAARLRLGPRFRYAIGSRAALAPLWRDYFASPQIGDPRTSSHTAAVWLVDARGRLRGMYPGGAPVSPADVAHDMRALGV
jgi:protein SCO1